MNENEAPGPGALYEIIGFGTVNQFDGAMVTSPELFGKRTDGRFDTLWEPANCEQQLILFGFESSHLGNFVAEFEVVPDVVAEFRQRPVFGIRYGFHHRLNFG